MENQDNLKWLNDSSYWKMGVFYFNKNDSRIFPPKRSGAGWTVNFANPYSIMANLGIIGLIVFPVILLSFQRGFDAHRYDKGGVKRIQHDSIK